MKQILVNLKLAKKLFIAPSLVILFLIVLGWVSYQSLSEQKSIIENLFNDRFKSYQASATIIKEIAQVHSNLYKVISWANAKYDEKKVEALGKEQLVKIDQSIQGVGKALNSKAATSEEKKLLQTSLGYMNEYKTAAFSAVDLSGSDLNMATMYMTSTEDKYQILNKSLQELLALEERLSRENYENSLAKFSSALKIFMVVLGIAIALSLLTSFFITRLVTAPVYQATGVIRKIAEGDLTQEIELSSEDEIGELAHSVNEMRLKMGEAVGQSAATSQALSEAASEQAASLEETSSSLEEMAAMTKKNAENTTQATGLMAAAQEATQKANRSMGNLTKSMGEIAQASEQTQKIVKTIDEIAFQTNLLALNAAVEAARAGEAGAGFAVVADEVRNLALRAAEAAKNTSNSMSEIAAKIKAGENLVTVTNKEFQSVSSSSDKVRQLMGEISASSQEQTQGIDQINRAVAEMNKVTQQNAASAEELASIMATFKVRQTAAEESLEQTK